MAVDESVQQMPFFSDMSVCAVLTACVKASSSQLTAAGKVCKAARPTRPTPLFRSCAPVNQQIPVLPAQQICAG